MFSQLTCSVQLKTALKRGLSYKNRCFSLVCNYLCPSNNSRQLIFTIKSCCFDSVNLLKFTKMLNVYLNLSIFAVSLKNEKNISKLEDQKLQTMQP